MSGFHSSCDLYFKQVKEVKKSVKKTIIIIVVLGIAIASATVFYLFNMPQRNVQATKTDFSLSASAVVNEYLSNADSANKKYLQEDGDSKILAISGKIFSITEDLKQQKVILLKDSTEKAGVSCTFTAETNVHTANLSPGQTVTIKGVIRSGAGYDKDLDLYENVIMEKCDIIN